MYWGAAMCDRFFGRILKERAIIAARTAVSFFPGTVEYTA
jgi:hypothetical protein